jgi:ppGpp synthetase/RelA/SpoT-type nucleotidyltranferase
MEEVCFLLKREIQAQNIELNGDIHYRIKKFDSLYDKIVRKEASGDPFDLIEDIAGVRIICLYRSDLEKIGKVITTNFNVISSDIKTQRTPSTEFGYMADHYIVKLSEACKGPRYDDLKSTKCEIQVRTILMDAWDSISHHLDYKQEFDIPSNLRKDFYALSGLFYVADTHFEIFRDSVMTLKSSLQETIKNNRFDLKQEINLTSLQTYLKWKLPTRKSVEEQDYSSLIQELRASGYNKFDNLDPIIPKIIFIAENEEKGNPPVFIKDGKSIATKYTDVGIIRVGLKTLDPKFLDAWLEKYNAKDREEFRQDELQIRRKYSHLLK